MIIEVPNDRIRHGDVILLTPDEQEYLSCAPWQFVLEVDARWWKHVYITTVKGTIKRKQPYLKTHLSVIDRLNPFDEFIDVQEKIKKDEEERLERKLLVYMKDIEQYKKGGRIVNGVILPRR